MDLIQVLQCFFAILLALSSFGQQCGGYRGSNPKIQPQRHSSSILRVPLSWNFLEDITLYFFELGHISVPVARGFPYFDLFTAGFVNQTMTGRKRSLR